MAKFTDCMGKEWLLEIKMDDIERIQNMVQDDDGKPLNLLHLNDTGQLFLVCQNVQRMLEIVFAICLEDILREFDVSRYDQEHAKIYECFPDREKETLLQKASRWFFNRIDGNALESMVHAFRDAVVNFTPNLLLRKALGEWVAKQKEVEQLGAERLHQAAEIVSNQAKEEIERKLQSLT